MKLKTAIKILTHHQKWRLGVLDAHQDPKTISEAINKLIKHAKK